MNKILQIIGILLVLGGAISLVFPSEQNHTLKVAFLDVGQGDAIYIETPDKVQVLIDTGAGKAILPELGRVMPWYDRSLDLVITTHPDTDHFGGFSELARLYSLAMVGDSGFPEIERDDVLYRSDIENEGAEYIALEQGMKLEVGESGVYLEVLYPVDVNDTLGEANWGSVVSRLVYGDFEVMLMGDSPRQVEELLLQDGINVSADIIKLGHHGSKTSSSERFLQAVNPDIGIISADANNRYGHPHQVVLDRLDFLGIEDLWTSDGTIIIESDGEEYWIKQ